MVTSFRIFAAGITVFAVLGLIGKLRRPLAKEWYFIIGGGLLSVVAHHAFLSVGLTSTSAANGGLILGAGPLLTAFFSAVLLRNRPTLIQIVGFLFGGAGVSFIILSGGRELSSLAVGDLFVFLSIISQALSFIVISKAAKTMDVRLLTGYMLLFGGLILFVLSLIIEPEGMQSFSNAPAGIWLLLAISAILATGIGHMVYNSVISKVGPAEASIFLNLNTFFSIAGSSLILGEVIRMEHYAGLMLIVTGVLCGSGALEHMMHRKKYQQHQEM